MYSVFFYFLLMSVVSLLIHVCSKAAIYKAYSIIWVFCSLFMFMSWTVKATYTSTHVYILLCMYTSVYLLYGFITTSKVQYVIYKKLKLQLNEHDTASNLREQNCYRIEKQSRCIMNQRIYRVTYCINTLTRCSHNIASHLFSQKLKASSFWKVCHQKEIGCQMWNQRNKQKTKREKEKEFETSEAFIEHATGKNARTTKSNLSVFV